MAFGYNPYRKDIDWGDWIQSVVSQGANSYAMAKLLKELKKRNAPAGQTQTTQPQMPSQPPPQPSDSSSDMKLPTSIAKMLLDRKKSVLGNPATSMSGSSATSPLYSNETAAALTDTMGRGSLGSAISGVGSSGGGVNTGELGTMLSSVPALAYGIYKGDPGIAASGVGSAAGGALGGPIGGLLGSLLAGLAFNSGIDWTK